MSVLSKIFDYGRRYGWRYTIRKVYRRFCIKYIWGRRKYPFSLSPAERKAQREEALRLSSPPLISIIVPLFHTPEKFLKEMLDSVLNQTYPNWELCLVDASSDNGLEKIVREFQKKAEQQIISGGCQGESRAEQQIAPGSCQGENRVEQQIALGNCQGENRIQYVRLGKNGGISENSNAAAKMARGEYIALLDHDDLLHPAALYEAVKVICQKKADFIYTDELSFVKKPSVVQSVHLKSDFRWEHLRSNNYICHLAVFSRELFWKVGGFKQEYDGAQDYDLFFRMAEESKEICHIPKVLYYWRLHEGSSAAGMAAKPYVTAAGKRALEEHLRRAGLSATVEETELGPFYRVCYQVPERNAVLILAEDEDTAGWLEEDLADCPYSVKVWCGELKSGMWFGDMDVGDVEPHGKPEMGVRFGEICGKQGMDEESSQIPNYVVLVRGGYHPIRKGWAWLTELLGSLQWREHSLAGALVYNKKEWVEHAGFYYDFGINNATVCYGVVYPHVCDGADASQGLGEVYSRYHEVPKAENGYMNHLRFPRIVDYLYGAVLAMEWEVFKQGFQGQMGEEWERFFAKEAWFSLCSKMKEQGKYSVLTVQEPWSKEE